VESLVAEKATVHRRDKRPSPIVGSLTGRISRGSFRRAAHSSRNPRNYMRSSDLAVNTFTVGFLAPAAKLPVS
jgi:hypothetical protein